jgi:lantibiotic modifying enzyme
VTTRREWLERVAGAAAFVGMPARWRAALPVGGRRGDRPYLDLALRCARWIETSRQETDHGIAWPANPLEPTSVELDLYNGMPGVILFYTELSRATGDERWRTAARQGVEHLAAALDPDDEHLDGGLYTGLAGFAFTFQTVADLGGDERAGQLADRALDRLAARARRDDRGADWGGSWDIISGNAGIGLLLLRADERKRDRQVLELARQAGRRLLAVGEPAEGGTMWYPAKDFRRNYPNFSHGTAGVSYFLASLYRRIREPEFLTAALAGARYLQAVATPTGDGALIFHNDTPDGLTRYYLSWCHGPAGTSRLFYRLHDLTGDRQWVEWIGRLTRGLYATGVPEQRTTGFWNNISQCCGNVGVGEFMIDLAGAEPAIGSRKFLERVIADTQRRRSEDADGGLRWIQAENRIEPEKVIAQTGYMQGAAGVGSFFLRLDAMERGTARHLHFPDSPFAAT